eukprot:1148678-Rhodomonas_salina.1
MQRDHRPALVQERHIRLEDDRDHVVVAWERGALPCQRVVNLSLHDEERVLHVVVVLSSLGACRVQPPGRGVYPGGSPQSRHAREGGHRRAARPVCRSPGGCVVKRPGNGELRAVLAPARVLHDKVEGEVTGPVGGIRGLTDNRNFQISRLHPAPPHRHGRNVVDVGNTIHGLTAGEARQGEHREARREQGYVGHNRNRDGVVLAGIRRGLHHLRRHVPPGNKDLGVADSQRMPLVGGNELANVRPP